MVSCDYGLKDSKLISHPFRQILFLFPSHDRGRITKMKVELLNYFGDDLMIVNAARVSYGKTKKEFDERDEKLIYYL